MRPAAPASMVACGLALLLGGLTDLAAQTRTVVTTPRTQLTTVPPPPPGPPPQGIRFEQQESFGVFARIRWNPAPNAASYLVSRARRDDATCCNTTSGPLPAGTTSWLDAGLNTPGYYRYTVAVTYADGSVGTEALDLLIQDGVAPNPVSVQDLGPGRIRINYNYTSPGIMGIIISGPGFGTGLGGVGQKLLRSIGPIDLTLPAGTHTWRLATVFNGQRFTSPVPPTYQVIQDPPSTLVVPPPSDWADLSHTVSYGIGRFRIALERFETDFDLPEDILRGDGRGNEIFISTQVNEYRRTGLVGPRMVRTPTFGDVHNFPSRVQAGSSSPNGGIRANDKYPAPVQLVSQLRPPGVTDLPFFLWEGELSEVEGVVILSPAIWEEDGDGSLFAHFMNLHSSSAGNLPSRSYLAPYFPRPSGRPASTWRPTTGNDCTYSDRFQLPQFGWLDEPIDISRSYPYCPKYVAINYEVARSVTSVNPAAVLEVPFFNSSGQYKLFIRIEKVTPPPASIAPVRTIRRSTP